MAASAPPPDAPVAGPPALRERTSSEWWVHDARKLVIVMVGLPARGKSFIARKLLSFHSWKGLKTRLFNVGEHRRKIMRGTQAHEFFAATNAQGKAAREQMARDVLEELICFLEPADPPGAPGEGEPEGDVAIFDATNSTTQRRRMVAATIAARLPDAEVIFLESICDDEAVLEENFRQKIRASPDYRDMDPAEASADFRRRIAEYERVYEPIVSEDLRYIKIFNLRSRIHANLIYGQVAQTLLPFLMSMHIGDRPIWLCRAGHCTEVPADTRGMDAIPCVASRSAPLSEAGVAFARRLAGFVEREAGRCRVFTSTLPRAVQTAQFVPGVTRQSACLNPLDKGDCYGMSMAEMQERLPAEYARWQADPFKERFPGGESYADLVGRLEPMLIEVEHFAEPVLVVSHISALQVLYAYFLNRPIHEAHEIAVPFHSVVELRPNQAGWAQRVVDLSS